MTSFLSARKRVEEFADVVDALLARTASGAAARPPATLEPLLDVVVALRSVPAPAPRPEFTALLRQRLLADAVTVLAPGAAPSPTRLPPPGRSRRPSRVAVAATAIVAVGGSAGVATAAQGALPGDALYPVKRALEGAEAKLSTSDTGRGRDLLAQASNRLDEAAALLPSVSDSAEVAVRVSSTIDAFGNQAGEGTDLILDDFMEDGERAKVVEVRLFTARSMTTLRELAATAPPDLDRQLREAARLMVSVDERAVGLCPDCGEGKAPLRIPAGFGLPIPAGAADAVAERRQDPDHQTTARGDASLKSRSSGAGAGLQGGPGGRGAPGAVAQPDPSVGLPTDAATPTGTPDPSVGVTDGPSGTPTEVPTETPTDPASGTPSDTPSDTPDPTPTDSPSGEPTDEPPASASGDPTADGAGDKSTGGSPDDPGGSTHSPSGPGSDGSGGPGSDGSGGPGDGGGDTSGDESGGGPGPSGDSLL